jgi:hypothetical protein
MEKSTNKNNALTKNKKSDRKKWKIRLVEQKKPLARKEQFAQSN